MSNLLLHPSRWDQSTLESASARLVRITAVRQPFRTERVSIELPSGGSVADIMCVFGIDPAAAARVFIGDRMVTLEERDHVHPQPGQTLTIRVLPTGGGNSKDTEILTIVVAAVAAVASYGAGSFISASLAASASATAAAGGAAAAAGPTLAGALAALAQGAIVSSINFLGQQLINSLIPPPKTPVPKQETTPQSYTVSGTANAAAPFAPIPKIYGTRRIFPQYAASPYNELVGFDQYLRMLFLLGYGPLDISQIKIGDTAIEDYEDVEWELRSGFTDDAPTRLYPGAVSEAGLNIQLSKTNGGGIAPTVYDWSQVPIQTSGTNADELGVDVSFPGGLAAFGKSSGKPIFIGCRLQIQWRPTGASNWTQEPAIVIKSTYIGTTGAGHVWRVPRGQYDVQATLTPFVIQGGDWTQNYVADGYWTALRTIRDQPPYAVAGLALLAVRIRASRQIKASYSQHQRGRFNRVDQTPSPPSRGAARMAALATAPPPSPLRLTRPISPLLPVSFSQTPEPTLGRPASRSFPVCRIRAETACSRGCNQFSIAPRTRHRLQHWRGTSADGRYQHPAFAFEIKKGHTHIASREQ